MFLKGEAIRRDFFQQTKQDTNTMSSKHLLDGFYTTHDGTGRGEGWGSEERLL